MSVVPEDTDFEGAFGFPTMLRFWIAGVLALALPNMGLIAEGLRVPLWVVLAIGFVWLEAVLRDRRIAKVAEAEGRFTDEELRAMLDMRSSD